MKIAVNTICSFITTLSISFVVTSVILMWREIYKLHDEIHQLRLQQLNLEGKFIAEQCKLLAVLTELPKRYIQQKDFNIIGVKEDVNRTTDSSSN